MRSKLIYSETDQHVLITFITHFTVTFFVRSSFRLNAHQKLKSSSIPSYLVVLSLYHVRWNLMNAIYIIHFVRISKFDRNVFYRLGSVATVLGDDWL